MPKTRSAKTTKRGRAAETPEMVEEAETSGTPSETRGEGRKRQKSEDGTGATVRIVDTQPVTLLSSLDAKPVRRWIEESRAKRLVNPEYDRNSFIAGITQYTLDVLFNRPGFVRAWWDLKDEELFTALNKITSTEEKAGIQMKRRLQELPAALDFQQTCVLKWIQEVGSIVSSYGAEDELSLADQQDVITVWLKKMRAAQQGDQAATLLNTALAQHMRELKPVPETLLDWLAALAAKFDSLMALKTSAAMFGLAVAPLSKRTHVREPAGGQAAKGLELLSNPGAKKSKPSESLPCAKTKAGKSDDKKECFGCGRRHEGACSLANHPDFNRSGRPWGQSKQGKA